MTPEILNLQETKSDLNSKMLIFNTAAEVRKVQPFRTTNPRRPGHIPK